MEKLLNLLLEGEKLSTEQMAEILSLSAAEVEAQLEKLEQEKILLGWRPIFHPKFLQDSQVRAVIEVRISPEREGGFDRLAQRISRFPAVESCYLMSGAYDLLVILKGKTLHEAASFVSEKLSSIDGVLSTATHFLLKAYKEQGFEIQQGIADADKPPVSP